MSDDGGLMWEVLELWGGSCYESYLWFCKWGFFVMVSISSAGAVFGAGIAVDLMIYTAIVVLIYCFGKAMVRKNVN